MWFRDETSLGEVNQDELLEKLRPVFKLILISLISIVAVVIPGIHFEKLSKMQDMLLGVYSSAGFALCPYVLFTMHCQIMQVSNDYRMIIIIMMTKMIFRSNYQDDIDCPVCRSKVQFPRGVLSKLPKNHLLMDLMESVGLKDRCLNQKQIHTILTDVSYFTCELKVYLTLRLVFLPEI